MPSKRHNLKCWPGFFQAMLDGLKTFDYRKNDRNFQVGDTTVQKEYDPLGRAFTGRLLQGDIKFIVTEAPGLPKGYCVMQLENIK